jgi:hypothetical protein
MNWKNIAIKATSAKSQIKSYDRIPDPGSLPSPPLNPVMDWNRRKIILFELRRHEVSYRWGIRDSSLQKNGEQILNENNSKNFTSWRIIAVTQLSTYIIYFS